MLCNFPEPPIFRGFVCLYMVFFPQKSDLFYLIIYNCFCYYDGGILERKSSTVYWEIPAEWELSTKEFGVFT